MFPWAGSSSTSESVRFVHGTESLQTKCIGGLLTSQVPFMFVYKTSDMTTADVWLGQFLVRQQYWSMMMGFRTVSMYMLRKVILDTAPDPPCHVLIRTPLSECLMTESLTVTLETQAREFRTPRLPMLHPLKGRSSFFYNEKNIQRGGCRECDFWRKRKRTLPRS